MKTETPENHENPLAQASLFLWRVRRGREDLHRQEINRLIFERPRTRPEQPFAPR